MTAGEDLKSLLNGALPAGLEWDERGATLVDMAAKQADLIEKLEAELEERGLYIAGSMGQPRLNPAVAELRLQNRALAQILGGLKFPGEAGGVAKDPKKQRGGFAMHQQRRGVGSGRRGFRVIEDDA
jgi:uncharacterized protein with von Willebrand factor type A (vWA) domain